MAPPTCYTSLASRHATLRGAWRTLQASEQTQPAATYYNLSCPLEMAKYSCVHQRQEAHAQRARDLTFEPADCVLPHGVEGRGALLPGRRIVFMGDSLAKQAYIAFGCLLSSGVQSIDDVKVFAGVKLDAHADTTTVISLEEDEKTSTDALVRVKCTLSTLNPKSGRALPAYKCSVLLTSARADERDGNSTSIARRPNLQDERTQWATARSMYDGTTLFHGRHFQMLEKVLNVSSAGITIQCKKDPQPELLGQDSGSNTAGLLDSVTLDGVMQAFLVWARDQRASRQPGWRTH